jgi:hypothetical protein
VNTPEGRKLAPSFIGSSTTPSPSSLMAVRPFTSITSSRPLWSAVAFLHARLSSAVHGAMSLPLDHRAALIRAFENGDLEHCLLPAPVIGARSSPNCLNRKSWNLRVETARSRISRS